MNVNLTPSDKARMREALQEALAIVEALPERTPCKQCEHFEGAKSYCGHWQTHVPAEAQEVGCETWVPAVPF